MIQWEPLDRDVLKALHDGQSLCPECLGHKHTTAFVSRDFLGDRERRIVLLCAQCGGTGLDTGVRPQSR